MFECSNRRMSKCRNRNPKLKPSAIPTSGQLRIIFGARRIRIALLAAIQLQVCALGCALFAPTSQSAGIARVRALHTPTRPECSRRARPFTSCALRARPKADHEARDDSFDHLDDRGQSGRGLRLATRSDSSICVLNLELRLDFSQMARTRL